ncbi:transposase [Streptosporangium roseum]
MPDQAAFATKSVLAAQMIDAALRAGVGASWVTGDEVYGQASCLRAFLEAHQLGYVPAIAGNRRFPLEGTERTATEAAAIAGDWHWHRYSAGAGAKGPRFYLWAWARIDADRIGGHRWLLIRRHPATGELAFYRCYAPSAMPLLSLVRIAGIRWAIEESFQAAKGQVGLDHYQVRSWIGWYRHITLTMLALVFLVAVAARQPDSAPEHIPLTMPEIRRLLALLVLTRHRAIDEVLRWSQWRRRHQATARRCHYQHRFDHDLKMSLE